MEVIINEQNGVAFFLEKWGIAESWRIAVAYLDDVGATVTGC